MKAPSRLDSLTPDARNPRSISPEARAAFKKSRAEFGDLSGFVVNRRTGLLICGHQTQKVLPADSPILITERFKKPDPLGTVARGHVQVGDDRIPYREVDWPEPKAHAAMIAANRHGGDFTRDLLAELLHEIGEAGIDKDLTGYFGEALDAAQKQAYDSLSRLTAVLDAEKSDAAPAPGAVPQAQASPATPQPGPAPAPACNILLAVTLTAAESGRWSEVKKRLDLRDDKKALLALITRCLDGE